MKKNIKINTIYSAIKTCAAIIFPLITFPYVSRVLLTDNLGKYNFAMSIISYASLIASLGVSTYAIRECSKLRDNKVKLQELASQIFTINILSTIIAYSILAIVLLIVRPLDKYRELIIILSFTIGCTTIGADWINNVFEDFKYITVRTVGFHILSIILMFVFVKTSEDYINYAIITVVSGAGSNIMNAFYRKKYCKIGVTKNLMLGRHLKPIIVLFSLQLVQIIYVNSDVTIIGFLRSDSEVGIYSAAVRIYNLIQTMINSVVLVVLPQLAQAYEKCDNEKINRLLRYGLNFTITLGLPCLIGANVVAKEIIVLFAGREYLPCIPSLRILTVALFWSFLGGFLGNMIMIPSGRENISLYSSIASASVNLVLNLILIPKWGIEAAAFTTALSMLIGFLFKLPFVDKNISICPQKDMIVGPIIGCMFILITGICGNHLPFNYWVRFIFVVCVSVLSYLICLIVFKNQLGVEAWATVKRVIKKVTKN